MTKVAEYLTEAAHYIDEGSRSIVESLTDAQFAIIVAATDALNEGCNEPGIDNGLVRTYETIPDFDDSRSKWNERGSRKELAIEAPAVKFDRVQMIKGQPRTDFVVVDLGDFRVVVK